MTTSERWRRACRVRRDLHYPSGFGHFDPNEEFHTAGGFSENCIEGEDRRMIQRWPRPPGTVAPPWEAVKMALGTVKWFNDAKGYGFISRSDGKDVFVHYSSISGDGFRTLNQGQNVEYEEQQGPKGLFAAKVMKMAE
jgi:cold shock protein